MTTKTWRLAITSYIALAAWATTARAITPDDPGAAAIQFTLDSGQNAKTISPYIYGRNSAPLTASATADRLGGNRWTGYNWETNASNAGADWYFESDNYLVSDPQHAPYANIPGGALIPELQADGSAGRSLIVTVPMAGYVAADMAGPVQLSQVVPSPRWKEVVPLKSSKYSAAAAALSLSPDTSDGYVFTDEYVNWVESHKAPGQQVFYDLDNEPGLWGEPLPSNWQPGVPPCSWCNPPTAAVPHSPEGRTHGELHPSKPTFTELADKTIANAAAIKSVNPDAQVLGGVGYGWNDFVSLQDAPDANSHTILPHPGGNEPSGQMKFYEYLLQQVHNAEVDQGKTLMDVLDLHWYSEARSGTNPDAGIRVTDNNNSSAVVDARVQAPRSLWDPTYTETSWISKWGTWVGSPGNLGPVKLLPRVQRDIDDFKPDTKIALSEYNFGGGNHVSGAVAEADVLGIFGRQGVFAANWWELDSGSSYVNAAFKMYLDYDGAGGTFGDTSVDADTSSITDSAVYASIDSTDPNRMVVVAINRTASAQTTGIAVTNDRIFDHAEIYQLTAASANPMRVSDVEFDLLNAFQYTMPAYSVSTLVLISDGLTGDFNRDGIVDAADYTVWRDQLGETGNLAADANEDNVVDAKDYDLWKSNFGQSELAGAASTAVPEPAAAILALFAASGLALRSRRG